MLYKLRDSAHPFWRFYEISTAIIGWPSIPVMLIVVVWNPFAPFFGLPQVFPEETNWLWGYITLAIAWIIKADWVKYKITRNPYDYPPYKWTLKESMLKRVAPGTFIFDHRKKKSSRGVIAECPSCHHLHRFPKEAGGLQVKCTVYGCEEMVTVPQSSEPSQ